MKQQMIRQPARAPASLATMIERIVSGFAPIAILLHGSQARGDAGPWSDVDLVVVLTEHADRWQAKREIEASLRDLQPRADVTVATPDEIRRRGAMVGTVLRPALREGRLLYHRPTDGRLPEVLPVSEEDAAKEAAVWLAEADEDLASADTLLDSAEAVARGGAFWAQQAAEKALKAVYVFLQIQYRLIHDLDVLRDGLPAGWRFKDEFRSLESLSRWAVTGRYPTAQPRGTLEDARRDLAQARALIAAVQRDLAEHGFNG